MSIAIQTNHLNEYEDLTRVNYPENNEEFNYNIFLTPVDAFYNGENALIYDSPCKGTLNFIESILYSDVLEKTLKEAYSCNNSNVKGNQNYINNQINSNINFYNSNEKNYYAEVIMNQIRSSSNKRSKTNTNNENCSSRKNSTDNEISSTVKSICFKQVKLSSFINLERIQLTRYEVEKNVLINSNNEDQEFSVKYTIDLNDPIKLDSNSDNSKKVNSESKIIQSSTITTASQVNANVNLNEKKSKIYELLNEKPACNNAKVNKEINKLSPNTNSETVTKKKKKKNKNKKSNKEKIVQGEVLSNKPAVTAKPAK